MRREEARIRGDVIGLVRQHFEGQLIEAGPKPFVPRAALDKSAHPGMQPCALVGGAVHHGRGGSCNPGPLDFKPGGAPPRAIPAGSRRSRPEGLR